VQQLEGVGPLVAKEAGDAPKHGEGFDGAGGFGATHVGSLPAELIEDGFDLRLGFFVVAADEHGGFAFRELRVDHEGGSDGAEGFDEVGMRKFGLQLFHQRFVGTGERFEDSVGGWGILDGVGRVDDGFVFEVFGSGLAESFGCGWAFDGEDD